MAVKDRVENCFGMCDLITAAGVSDSQQRNLRSISALIGAAGVIAAYCDVTVVDCTAVLTLPSFLTEIEDEAFWENDLVQLVRIPAGVTAIGSYAFAFMTDLVAVDISADDIDIASDAFWYSEPVILCLEGSDAAQFAQTYGYQYLVR